MFQSQRENFCCRFRTPRGPDDALLCLALSCNNVLLEATEHCLYHYFFKKLPRSINVKLFASTHCWPGLRMPLGAVFREGCALVFGLFPPFRVCPLTFACPMLEGVLLLTGCSARFLTALLLGDSSRWKFLTTLGLSFLSLVSLIQKY